jgi:hypothetical protein
MKGWILTKLNIKQMGGPVRGPINNRWLAQVDFQDIKPYVFSSRFCITTNLPQVLTTCRNLPSRPYVIWDMSLILDIPMCCQKYQKMQ